MARLHLMLCCAVVLLTAAATADAKRAPQVAAMIRHRDWQAKVEGRRRLMQADEAAASADSVAAPAAAPAGPPLELPENPLETCSYEKVREATKCKNSKAMYYLVEGADEECCQLMSKYYSNASKLPTRNCWCDADVWARELELEIKNFVVLGSIFDSCVAANYTVGDEAVNYYQDGAGPCAGMAPMAEAAPAEEVAVTTPPPRSFGKWVREALPDNPWLMISFIVSIFSMVGFSIMMWPFVFHAIMEVVEFPSKLRSKKAL